MTKPSSQLFIANRLLCLLLIGGFAPNGWAEKVDARVERVRRDLGYYQNADKEPDAVAAEIRNLREEFRQAMQRQEARIQHLEEELKTIKSQSVVAHPSPPLPAASAASPASMPAAIKVSDNLSVCHQGCDFQDLQKAVDAVPSGGTITVSAEINGSCAVIRKPLKLIGLKGENGLRAHLAGGVCMGKATLITAAANILIEGFEISNIAVGDGNGACVRLDPGTRDLVLRNLYCHDSQDGLLGAIAGQLLIEDSIFLGNGFGEGQAHGMYINGDEVVIRHSQILATKNAGHSLKLGVKKLLVEDSMVAALNARNSRALDAYAGGMIVLRRNVIQQGPQSDNSDVIGIALEPSRLLPSGHSLLMEDNWVIYDDVGRGSKVLLRDKLRLGAVTLKNNVMVGLTGMGVDGIKAEGNRWIDTREEAGLPKYEGSLKSLPSPKKH